jgi:16S rRNA (guanine527-N7)-methyltransferase
VNGARARAGAGGPAGRLADLGLQWRLGPEQVASLWTLLELLESDEHAPTTVRRASEAVDVHVADSLSALALADVRGASSVADLGSGAGFPGLVLAVALPQASVALVESASRKCEFLERAISGAGIANAHVVCTRAESWSAGEGANDLVAARAVAPLAVLCEYASPLLRPGGALVAWKGEVAEEEALAGGRAAAVLGLRSEDAVRSEPYPGSVAHHLHVFRKVAQTPAGYPRRPGIARRRPLGGGVQA